MRMIGGEGNRTVRAERAFEQLGPGSRVPSRRSAGTARAEDMRAGFTLIELITVIAIVGLLSATLVAGVSYLRARARDVRRVTDVNALQKGFEVFLTSNGTYPAAATDTCLTGADTVSAALKAAGAMNVVPVDPLPANVSDPAKCYLYKQTEDPTSYALQYVLETNSNVGSAGAHAVGP